MDQKAMLIGRQGFSQVILLGIIAVFILAGAGGFLVLREKRVPSSEGMVQEEVSSEDVASPIEPTPSPGESIQAPKPKTQPELRPKSVLPPVVPVTIPPTIPATVVKNTSGYTFTIAGFVYDKTDAPVMTDGTPVAGIAIRVIGPKTVATQTRTNGSYTLSFANAPVGTYDVCITIPAGYRINPPSGCERVIVRLLHQGISPSDTTLEFENNGHTALNGTAIGFNILRQEVLNECGTDYNPFCGKDGKNYQNACYATKAGVEINYPGECRAGVVTTCEGYNGPLCGYDNKTYANECAAKEANVMIQYVGECR